MLSRLLITCVLLAGCLTPAWAAAPDDAVRSRFSVDFSQAIGALTRLGDEALADARGPMAGLPARWSRELKQVDQLLAQHQHRFFPMMHRPWTRESAVYSNLQGARMWLWSIYDGLNDHVAGVESIDLEKGRVRAELLSSFMAYLDKAVSLMNGGPFAGSYFEDTLVPILADYCAYPEDGQQVKPDFQDAKLFDQVEHQGKHQGGSVRDSL